MIKLYDSAFSPFARKVRMVLDHKGLDYETVDGLLKSNHDALKVVNGRIEVPALVDGDIVVVNYPTSSPIWIIAIRRCRSIPRCRPRASMRAPGSACRYLRRSDLRRCLVLEMGRAAGPDAARLARRGARRSSQGL